MLSFSINKKNHNFRVPDSVKKVIYSEDGELHNEDKNGTRSRDWVSTWYFNTLKGTASEEDTDINAYSYACEQNQNLAISAREVAILSEEEMENGARGGICEIFLEYTERKFETLEEQSEFMSAYKNLMDMAEVIEIEDNVDIVTAMLNAFKGNSQSVQAIKNLIAKYEKLGDVLFTIMSKNWVGIIEEVRGTYYC